MLNFQKSCKNMTKHFFRPISMKKIPCTCQTILRISFYIWENKKFRLKIIFYTRGACPPAHPSPGLRPCGGIYEKHHPTNVLTNRLTNYVFDPIDDIAYSQWEFYHTTLVRLVSCQILLYASTMKKYIKLSKRNKQVITYIQKEENLYRNLIAIIFFH